MGSEANKVFLSIAGVPLLTRAVTALAGAPGLAELIVVARPEEMGAVVSLIPPLGVPVRIVAGGTDRQDSSRAGVAAASGEIVLVHDAARPFPPPDLVARVVDGARRHGACIPVLPVADTLRQAGDAGFARPGDVAREGLLRVQTPQGFRRDLLDAALRAWPSKAPMTDDAAAVLALGHPVATTAGDERNLKVTTRADLDLAAALATLEGAT